MSRVAILRKLRDCRVGVGNVVHLSAQEGTSKALEPKYRVFRSVSDCELITWHQAPPLEKSRLRQTLRANE